MKLKQHLFLSALILSVLWGREAMARPLKPAYLYAPHAVKHYKKAPVVIAVSHRHRVVRKTPVYIIYVPVKPKRR